MKGTKSRFASVSMSASSTRFSFLWGAISQFTSEFESTLPVGRLQSFGTSALSVSWTATTAQHPPYQGAGMLCLDSFPGPMVGETDIFYPVALPVPPSIRLKGWGRFYPGFSCVVEFCP